MDSDRTVLRGRINATKRRVRDEMESRNLFCWVTKGKEIENYVSAEAINQCFGCNLMQIDPYELFPEYIKKYDKGFLNHKVDTARKLCEFITEENSSKILDLKNKIERLKSVIISWNAG